MDGGNCGLLQLPRLPQRHQFVTSLQRHSRAATAICQHWFYETARQAIPPRCSCITRRCKRHKCGSTNHRNSSNWISSYDWCRLPEWQPNSENFPANHRVCVNGSWGVIFFGSYQAVRRQSVWAPINPIDTGHQAFFEWNYRIITEALLRLSRISLYIQHPNARLIFTAI